MPDRSSTPTSSTATPPPAASTAARTAAAQGVSTAMRAGTPQAASAAASSAVPTGPSVSGAATSPRGTKKPVIRPTLVAPASASRRGGELAGARRDQLLRLAADVAADQRFDGGDAIGITFPWRHTLPSNRAASRRSGRRRARASSRSSPAASRGRPRPPGRPAISSSASAKPPDPVLRQELRLPPHQLLIGGRLRHGNAAQQRMDVLGLRLALHHDEVELEGGVTRRLLAGLVADDDADRGRSCTALRAARRGSRRRPGRNRSSAARSRNCRPRPGRC